MKQKTFASMAYEGKKRQTRRERFLAEMEEVVPWSELVAVVEPHYPKAGKRGRPPKPLEAMLRIYFMQQWYALSDPAMEDALYEVDSMRRFAGLDLECVDDRGPPSSDAQGLFADTDPRIRIRRWSVIESPSPPLIRTENCANCWVKSI